MSREVRRGRTTSGQVRGSIIYPESMVNGCVICRLENLGVLRSCPRTN